MLVVFYSKFTTEPSILQTWWHYILSKILLCGRPHWGARVYEMKANYKNSAVIPDTSALMKNCNVLNFLLEDFKTVIISQTTLDELNFQKDKKKNNQAWLAMQKIEQVKKNLKI